MKINIQHKLKRIIIISSWVLSIAGMLVLLGFVNYKQTNTICKNVIVAINEGEGHDFVDGNDILQLVNSKGKLVGKSLANINKKLLEKIVMSSPFVERVEVYSTLDGNLHIDAWQRDPIVRVYNMQNEQFFIDKSGAFMPVSEKYTPSVVVANGYIYNTYAEMKIAPPPTFKNSNNIDSLTIPRMINQVYRVASFIAADTFWSANTQQIYVNELQEIELVPRVGDHRILLGDTTDLQDKFNRLFLFYKKGLSNTGWNKYSLINLKFKNQVVCTKK
ncbi:MAG: cell division protein FtsQ/DivIB [Bacteroidota bacterium]